MINLPDFSSLKQWINKNKKKNINNIEDKSKEELSDVILYDPNWKINIIDMDEDNNQKHTVNIKV